MAVDVSTFESVEEIEKHYRKVLAKADDSEEQELRAELADAKVKFYEHKARQSELALAKRDAIEKFPLAKGFEDLVTGDDPAVILNSAKRVHERFEQMQKDETAARDKQQEEQAAEQEKARAAYGSPAGAAGGATPAPPEYEQSIQKTRETLQQGDAPSKLKTNQYINHRFREAVIKNRSDSSYRAGSTTPRYGPDRPDLYNEAQRRG